MDENPGYLVRLADIERVRQEYKSEQYRRVFRSMTVVYIYGDTATGKTRSVMDNHGYENVYRVSEYDHPFDGYLGQDVIVFDEFQSQFRISEMLNYLDGYPLSLSVVLRKRDGKTDMPLSEYEYENGLGFKLW